MLNFFDCNVMIGPRRAPRLGSFTDIRTLQKKMKSAGIEKALVYHSLAKEHEPMYGNLRLVEELKSYQNLVPTWVVLPNITGDFLDEDQLLLLMRKQGIKALRIFSGKDDFNFPLHPLVIGNLFHVLEQHKIPVFIDYGGTNFAEIISFLSEYKRLKVVFTNVSHRIYREIIPLLHSFKNFYLEISCCKVFRGIEAIVREAGSERLVFGSGLPVFSAGSAVTLITHADISMNDKENIAFRNMEHLLEEVEL